MRVIVPPDAIVKMTIGDQKTCDSPYRWSRYALKKTCGEETLIYNILTCELIVLSPQELITAESNTELIKNWFLVREDFDEYQLAQQTKHLRQMIYRSELKSQIEKPIEGYWILTTTGCNAHCFYCHEKGIPQMSMTQQTADDVVQYILNGKKTSKIRIMWYGGEPLVNEKAIDYISKSLKEYDISFYSTMISNGFLFTAETAAKARQFWNLTDIQITLDGMEATYNKVKAYDANSNESPFEKVIENIGTLLRSGIGVKVRLNLDKYNATELFELADYLFDRFGQYRQFSMYSAPLLENCLGTDYTRGDTQRAELFDVHFLLSDRIKSYGVLSKSKLAAAMRSETRCIAVSNVRVIFPDGQLAFCHDYADGILSGSIYGEEPAITERNKYTICVPPMDKCGTCIKFPQCVRFEKCFNNQCNEDLIREWVYNTKNEMEWEYEKYTEKEATT